MCIIAGKDGSIHNSEKAISKKHFAGSKKRFAGVLAIVSRLLNRTAKKLDPLEG